MENLMGVEQIAQVRAKQLMKGHSVKDDIENYPRQELLSVARAMLMPDTGIPDKPLAAHSPGGWNPESWGKLIRKPYKERLAIAGAMIAAELDRLDALDNRQDA